MRLPTRRGEIESQHKRKIDPHLTPAAIRRLKAELKELEERALPAAEEVRRTGAFGDFSENAEYQHAKSELRKINSRILVLQTRIAQAIPIAAGKSDDGQVHIGSRVSLKINGREITYEIVGSEETNPSAGRISHHSPLGAKLLNHKPGDTISVETRDGRSVKYKIISVT